MDEQNTAPNPPSLKELKEKIAAEIRPLVPQLKEPGDRFYALISLLREKWDDNLAGEVFEAAKSVNSPDEKVRAFQDLMSEIGYHERDLEDHAPKQS